MRKIWGAVELTGAPLWQVVHPETTVADGLTSYPAATWELGCNDRHRAGRLRYNNRAENSHISICRRECKLQRFKSYGSSQKFLAIHAAISKTVKVRHHLISRHTLYHLRTEAMATWVTATLEGFCFACKC